MSVLGRGLPALRTARQLGRGLLQRSDVSSAALDAVVTVDSIRRLHESSLFDREWYETLTAPFPSRLAAVRHYLEEGVPRSLSPNPLFEHEWLSRAPLPGRDMLLQFGFKHGGSRCHPFFDGTGWAKQHPESRSHPEGVLAHFLATATDDTIMPVSDLFQPIELTWGRVRALLWEHGRLWARQERARREERVVDAWDGAAEQSFRQRWQDTPLPDPAGRPLVSVIMPVRNRPTAVLTAIASVRSQTMTEWELIVVDDGSTDATAAVLATVAAGDPRIVVVTGPAQGVSAARNAGADRARGRYIAWLDSDNFWTPDFLRLSVTVAAARGLRAVHGAVEMRKEQQRKYRSMDVHADLFEEMMQVGNHVDLNILLVEASLLAEVGGFDTQLKRTVDYDLVWRISRVAQPVYLPIVGVIYLEDKLSTDRISVTEVESWNEVVKNDHLIDWAGLERELPARVPGRTSILMPTFHDWMFTNRALRAVLRAADEAAANGEAGADVEVVLLDNGSRRAVGAILNCFAESDPRVKYVRAPVNMKFALGSNLAFAASTGDRVVFLNNDTTVWPGWLGPLLSQLDDDHPEVLGAQPLLVYPGGTIQCGGLTFPRTGVFPTHFLLDFPVEDATRIGRSFDVHAVTGAAMALRAADVVATRGFDPIYLNGWEDVDLCLRLAARRPGMFRVVTDSLVTHHESRSPGRGIGYLTNRKIFRDRWSHLELADDDHMWRQVGLEVAQYGLLEGVSVKVPGELRVPQPVLVRDRSQRIPGSTDPSLRWALKIAAPAGERSLWWGDLFFARSLAAALERLGQHAVIDTREQRERRTITTDDVVLWLRGLDEAHPQPGKVNMLWVISHPDALKRTELDRFPLLFAASEPWARAARGDLDLPVQFLAQATDPGLFHPVEGIRAGEEIVFVGNSRNIYRPVVRGLVEAGVPVSIYGGGWEQFVPREYVRAERVPNEDVAALYRSARVVLTDHWTDMRQAGFMSNRLYDAAAAGARIISDPIAGLEAFGGLAQAFTSPAHLVELATRPDDFFPSHEAGLEISARVRSVESFDARARQLLDSAVKELRPGS